MQVTHNVNPEKRTGGGAYEGAELRMSLRQQGSKMIKFRPGFQLYSPSRRCKSLDLHHILRKTGPAVNNQRYSVARAKQMEFPCRLGSSKRDTGQICLWSIGNYRTIRLTLSLGTKYTKGLCLK
jgi:hypothetical protein